MTVKRKFHSNEFIHTGIIICGQTDRQGETKAAPRITALEDCYLKSYCFVISVLKAEEFEKLLLITCSYKNGS